VSAEPDLQPQCVALLNELGALRAFSVPPHDATPDAVHEALRELRAALDRAEVLMTEAASYRRRAKQAARRAADAAADAYDAELKRFSTQAMARQFESIKDREVQARVKVSPQYKEARKAQELAGLVEEAEDAARRMFFGLRDIRAELLTTLDKYLPWRASMEF
jgi:hypothetical protein